MSYDDAILALSKDALKFVKDDSVLGLGSGRAVTSFVKELGKHIKTNRISIRCVPTSLQIKLIAEQNNISLIEADQIDTIDVVFDGADQIDSKKNMIKGGGGALLRENILINAAKKVVIMADKTKFVTNLDRTVPVEVHPLARKIVEKKVLEINGKSEIRSLDRGYPFITENGNIILDCNFGTIKDPSALAGKVRDIAGVLEIGIFTRKPDVIYKAKEDGKFDIIT